MSVLEKDCNKIKDFKNFGSAGWTKNSIRCLEAAIILARNCGTTSPEFTPFMPPHSEL